jgi:hypothetical protein
MSKHYNGILELNLKLLEEAGEETFLVLYVPAFSTFWDYSFDHGKGNNISG